MRAAIWLILSFLLFGLGAWVHGVAPGVACGTPNTTYISQSTGNWNVNARWSPNTNFPHCVGDVAIISQQQTITIPSGINIISTVTYVAGVGSNLTTVAINGSLKLDGTMTIALISALNMGPGGLLDLNGHNITNPASATTQYNFSGNTSNHATVTDTSGHGQFQQISGSIKSTWSYVDVSNLGNSIFGRGACQTYNHSTWTNNAAVYLDVAGGTFGIVATNLDFRQAAGTAGASAQEPVIDYNSNALSSCPSRTVNNITWAITGTPTLAQVGQMFVRGTNFDPFTNWVISDYLTIFSNPSMVLTSSYQVMHPCGAIFSLASSSPNTVSNSYLYSLGGPSHPMQPASATSTVISGNVLEAPVQLSGCTGVGLKWICCSIATGGTLDMHGNVALGIGSLLDIDLTEAPTLNLYNNTSYVDMLGAFETTPSAVVMRVDHSAGLLSGTANFYNNLVVNPNNPTPQNTFISLWVPTAGQITLEDYNVGWNSGGAPGPVIYNTYGCLTPFTNCSSAAFPAGNALTTIAQGANDFAVNPNFVDPTRNLRTWDTSLGGPGTEANVTAQMLMMNGYGGTFNAAYNPSAAVSWVRSGFIVGNTAALGGTGMGGADVGALPVFTGTCLQSQTATCVLVDSTHQLLVQ